MTTKKFKRQKTALDFPVGRCGVTINWEKEYIKLWNVSEQLLENIDGLKIHSRGALIAFKNGVDYGRNLDAFQQENAADSSYNQSNLIDTKGVTEDD